MMKKAYRLLSSIWLGSIVFFSFVIAPQIFKVLPRFEAAKLQNHLFPFYYSVGIVCALGMLFYAFFKDQKKITWIAIALALSLIGLTTLSPLIKEAFLSQNVSIKWLHPTAIGLNLAMLFCVFKTV
jgi:membrane-associated HD superfamily phosphohydrolase